MLSRLASDSVDAELDVQLCCSSALEADPEMVVLQEGSPPLASAFALSTSFEDDVLDLKWRQSCCALLSSHTFVLSLSFWFFHFCFFGGFLPFKMVSWNTSLPSNILGLPIHQGVGGSDENMSPLMFTVRHFVGYLCGPVPPQQQQKKGFEVLQDARVCFSIYSRFERRANWT